MKNKQIEQYIIEESDKYKGCFNIYEKESGNRVAYFASNNSKKNYNNAVNWVEQNSISEQHAEKSEGKQHIEKKHFDLACQTIDAIYDIADTEVGWILQQYFRNVDKLYKRNKH